METKRSQNNIENSAKDEIDLLEVFLKIWKFRRFIFLFTFSVIIISVIYALVVEPQYEASVTLYKEMPEGQSVERMQGLASQFGIGGSLGDESQFSIEDLLDSRNINERIIYNEWNTEEFDKPVNLIEYWEIDKETEEKSFFSALGKLKNKISTETSEETGLITITVQTAEPKLSADIANFITKIIEDYIQEDRKTSTQENMKYLDQRVSTVKEELENAEEKLKEFRESNRSLRESPRLQMELGRLERQVTIKQEVYVSLESEKEMTEVELVKETPVINVLDDAVKPEQGKLH
ncbi:MAG: Wzz/FepE/Etk N-terminal domain-containing protein [Bacteroidota bacterium]